MVMWQASSVGKDLFSSCMLRKKDKVETNHEIKCSCKIQKKQEKSISLYLHLFIDMYWITQSPVVEGEVKVDTSTSVVCLSHPLRKTTTVKFCWIW